VSRATAPGGALCRPQSAVPRCRSTEPRRERPRLPPRRVTLRAAQGSFTSRFRMSVSTGRCGAAAAQTASRRATCSRARWCASFEHPKRSYDSAPANAQCGRKDATNHTAIVPHKPLRSTLTIPGRLTPNDVPERAQIRCVQCCTGAPDDGNLKENGRAANEASHGSGATRPVRRTVSAWICRRRRACRDRAGRMGAFTPSPCFHPSVEQLFEERVTIHRNLEGWRQLGRQREGKTAVELQHRTYARKRAPRVRTVAGRRGGGSH